jgi:hypothetical protein
MVKRRGDTTPEPPGGRAAERLRMFEDARRPKLSPAKRKKPRKAAKQPGVDDPVEAPDEKQVRRKD